MKRRSGFTLIEVLLAVGLMGLTLISIVVLRTKSVYNSGNSQELAVAMQLLQDKTAEAVAGLQTTLNSSGIEGAKTKAEGVFEEPYEKYSWEVELRPSTIQLDKATLGKVMADYGADPDTIDLQLEKMALVLSNLNLVLEENFAEVEVRVNWKSRGEEFSVPIITHLIPETPKINIHLQPRE